MDTTEYRFTPAGVRRMSDRVFIPEDMGNKDWVTYLEWVADGGQTLPEKTVEETANEERRWRDVELQGVAWLRERHRDEVELGSATSLTSDEYGELLAYMQLLRDWPQSSKFPVQKYRPKKPSWIALQTQ